jgi:hypothetical protein
LWADGAWLVAGLPLVVVASGGLYHGTFALWTVLLVLLGACALATLREGRPTVVYGLVASTLAVAVVQYRLTRRDALAHAESLSATRRFYQELTEGLLGRDPAARYGLLFDAGETVFVNTAFFDRGIWPRGSVSFHTVVDSYYRQHFPGEDPQQAAQHNLDALNARVGTLAAAFCGPDDVARSLGEQPFSRAAGIAASVASGTTRAGARCAASTPRRLRAALRAHAARAHSRREVGPGSAQRSLNSLYRRVCRVSMDCGTPSTNTSVTCTRASITSPVARNRFAALPTAIEPTRSATPKISAGDSVIARSARVRRQAERPGHGRLVGQVARLGRVVRDDREPHARAVQRGRVRVRGVVGIGAAPGQAVDVREHRHVLLLQQVGAAPGLQAAGDHQLQAVLRREGHRAADVLLGVRAT